MLIGFVRRSIPLVVLFVLSVPVTQAAPAVQVVPHRALYELTLDRASRRSKVVEVKGRLAFEWADSCDGWTVEQRYELELLYSEGAAIEILTSYVVWEAKDGLRYRFNVRRHQNGELDDEFRGKAALSGKGRTGRAVYTRPKQEAKLPLGTLFPADHTIELIERALAGDKIVQRKVFDGATEHGTMLINAVIGKALAPAEAGQHPLANAEGWHMRLAYFAIDKVTSTPEYEIGLELQDNGIARAVDIDYGDFAIRGALQHIERLPEPDC